MYQFFVSESQIAQNRISIEGEDVNHISHVLRMKPGEKIRVSSQDTGVSYFCHIEGFTEDTVTAVVDSVDEAGTELENRIVLFQGLPKADKMELIIQKAVELGASQIVPVAMKNCVMKLEPKKVDSRLRRWNAISESAAKQSKRTRIPEVTAPVSWKEALRIASELDVVLVPYENERGMEATRERIDSLQRGQSIGIMIGPEGGFSDAEIKDTQNYPQKMFTISLGRRILRTETAGLAALAMLVYRLDQ